MSEYNGSAAFSLDSLGARAVGADAAASHAPETAWQPSGETGSPALELQRRLHASLAAERELPEIFVPAHEQALRLFSRGMGYASLLGAAGGIAWLILG